MAQKKEKPAIVQSRQPFLVFFTKNQRFALHRSALTPLLNRQDVMVPARQIKTSSGATVNVRGKTWHRGTTTFTTDNGQRRTLTHLQSLTAPAQHYYFDRSLSDEQAVGVASGQVDPETIPGYVDRITAAESLCPGWAGSKRAVLLAL